MRKPWHTVLSFAVVALSAGVTPAADGTFDSNGVTIRYVTEGTGEPVVLLHGWMSDSSMWGRDQAGNTKLDMSKAKGFQVIAIDLRGHGKSGKPHDVKEYGAAMAEDVVRLLDHLKLPKAHLVGYSMGAFVAGKVAATHPDRVLSVIYGGQAPIVLAAGATFTPSDEVELFAKAVEEGRELGPYIIAITPAGMPKLTEKQAKAYAHFLYNGKDLKAYAAAGRGFEGLAVTNEQLKACPAPALFLHGSKEAASTIRRVGELQKILAKSEVKVIDGGNHMTTLTNPEFGNTIMKFLRANSAK